MQSKIKITTFAVDYENNSIRIDDDQLIYENIHFPVDDFRNVEQKFQCAKSFIDSAVIINNRYTNHESQSDKIDIIVG